VKDSTRQFYPFLHQPQTEMSIAVHKVWVKPSPVVFDDQSHVRTVPCEADADRDSVGVPRSVSERFPSYLIREQLNNW